MSSPILVGAVIYDPKVALIWDIIKDFFINEGCPIDYVFYSNYELMTDALVGGHVHIAWNSPLAWVDAVRRTGGKVKALAMRDTDRDRVTHVVVKKDAGITSIADLRGKTVATGAKDSPQATLLPLHLLQKAGLAPYQDFAVRRFDLLVGKHGDHIGGEREALRSLEQGETHASCVLDLNWERWTTDGTIDPTRYQVLATTPAFDHCNFTVLDSYPQAEIDRWTKVLFRMTYENPAHRDMMDMEGLKAWLPGRTSHYADLTAACEAQKFFEVR
jgi:phosphonate transport system substrate-binding protein